MGLLSWLRQRSAGKENVALEIDKDEEELSGLNLKSAVEAHMAWRQRLTQGSRMKILASKASRTYSQPYRVLAIA